MTIKQIKLKNTDDPIIRINWRRLGNIIMNFLVWWFLTIVKIVEVILKFILKVLTLILIGLYEVLKAFGRLNVAIFNALKKFSKHNIKGFWILILVFLFLLIGGIGLFKGIQRVNAQNRQIIDMKSILDKQIKDIQQLQKDIKEKDLKLESKAKEEKLLAQKQAVLANRNKAEENLPVRVKNIIASNALVYGVKDVRLIECTVFHESGGRDEAVGDSGDAIGVAQYHLATFLGHRKQMGLPAIDLRKNTEASIQAMVYSISKGGIGNWSARTKCI